jgi:hypothetical protein
MRITARTKRGPKTGETLTPHLHRDGKYVVSETRFKEDHIYLDTLEEVASHIEAGFHVRMSPEVGKRAASLMSPASIKVEQ